MPVKFLGGVTCKTNKSLEVSDQTIQAEGLGDFFDHLGKAATNTTKIKKNPGRALGKTAIIGTGTAAASKNPKLIAATAPDFINNIRQGKDLYLGKFRYIFH